MAIKNPELIPLFNQLKAILETYSKHFDVLESEGAYHLIYIGEVKFDKYVRDEVYFASLMIQKNFVGFYFMPQYTTQNGPEYFAGQNMLKLLKGKSCYNITQKAYTENTNVLKEEIETMLKKGVESYKKLGWTKN